MTEKNPTNKGGAIAPVSRSETSEQSNWKECVNNQKAFIDTGRKLIPLMKYPQDLDFSKTVGGTTYVVKSHFNKNANDSLLKIISRLCADGKNLSE